MAAEAMQKHQGAGTIGTSTLTQGHFSSTEGLNNKTLSEMGSLLTRKRKSCISVLHHIQQTSEVQHFKAYFCYEIPIRVFQLEGK